MADQPKTVTISRDVFERTVGVAFAAYALAQWNQFQLIKAGIITADDALIGLRGLADIAKQAGPLPKLAVPKLAEALDQLQKAITAGNSRPS